MDPLKQEMKPLTKVVSEWVHEYFKSTDLKIFEDGNRATYQFTGEDGGDFNYNGYVEVYEERWLVDIFLYAEVKVPNRKRRDVAELLARVNYDLLAGLIGLDFESGEIRYKNTLDVRDGLLSIAMVNSAVDRGISILDRFLPAVLAVTHANIIPEDAYTEVDDDKPKKAKLVLPKVEPLGDALTWDSIAGHVPIKTWAADLKHAIENTDDNGAWALAGRGVVLINDDEGYCREVLRRVATDAGMKFIIIPRNEVVNMAPAAVFRGMAPLLIYLEPERWMQGSDDDNETKEEAEAVRQFRSNLSGWMREFNPSRPVVFALSASDLDSVDESLRQVELFDRFVSLPSRSLESTGLDFIQSIDQSICATSLIDSPGKVGRLVTWEFNQPEQRKMAVLSLKRIHARENRPLEFLDLVHIATHSLIEEGLVQPRLELVRRQTAYHEAGHAIVAILESDGQDIPDYTSIMPGSSGFGGITVESYRFYYSKNDDQKTYHDFRRDIRVSLAGRAAEELLVGAEHVSSGASGDLESVARQMFKAFARWGFAPFMEKAGQSESNLSLVLGEPTPSEYEHVEKLSRMFVAKEYLIVIEQLTKHRHLLDDVASRLLWDPVVDQDELIEICCKHNVQISTEK